MMVCGYGTFRDRAERRVWCGCLCLVVAVHERRLRGVGLKVCEYGTRDAVVFTWFFVKRNGGLRDVPEVQTKRGVQLCVLVRFVVRSTNLSKLDTILRSLAFL